MFKKLGTLLILLALVTVVVASNHTAPVKAQGVSELTIWWAEWDPANYLQQLANDYETETGIKVTASKSLGAATTPKLVPNGQPRATVSTWSSATANGSDKQSPKVTILT